MIKVAVAALTFLATDSVVSATHRTKDGLDYPEVAQAMKNSGKNYYWKTYDERTSDGHDLTLFRMKGGVNKKPIPGQWSKGVILLLNGFTKDAFTWFDTRSGDPSKPVMPVQLFDLGYDVWIGNIRGNRYSRGHKTLDINEDDRDFFDFAIEDIAKKDLPEMVQQIMYSQAWTKKRGGGTCKKITMIGHSAGAGQMLAALSFTKKADRYVSQFIGLEPCLIANADEYYEGLGMEEYIGLATTLDFLGIYSYFGDNWEDQVNMVCDVVGRRDLEADGDRLDEVRRLRELKRNREDILEDRDESKHDRKQRNDQQGI